MGELIKSRSIYIKQKKHQLINDGSIYERDYVTTGDKDSFGRGIKPFFKEGNFVITVNEDEKVEKEFFKEEFVNGDDYYFTLGNIKKEEPQRDTIVIKQNIHDLREFAYFGSCTELIRASINGIFRTFPGELYFDNKVTYWVNTKGELSVLNGLRDCENHIDGNKDTLAYVVANPFNIKFTQKPYSLENDEPLKKLKDFALGVNNRYYEIIRNGSASDVTSYTYTPTKEKGYIYSVNETIADVVINGIKLKYVKGEDKINYLLASDTSNYGVHIRPKKEWMDIFYKSLKNFQKVLLNRDSKPLYKSYFNILTMDENGIKTTLKSFVFPIGSGNYNIGSDSPLLEEYISSLYDIATLYDEYFTDNMWRIMTHESIKNFDWSYTRSFPNMHEDEYLEGGNKISKLIRLYGREFDEIKSYIDNIRFDNNITYNGFNNTPDYFLKDLLDNYGWDTKKISKYINEETTVSPYFYEINQNNNSQPYYLMCDNGTAKRVKTSGDDSFKNDILIENGKGKKSLCNIFKKYRSEKKYDTNIFNNEFMKRLKINSRYIISHKGTIDGIEMMLALFGIRSKRWCDGLDFIDDDIDKKEFTYDYTIKEYKENLEKSSINEEEDDILFTNSTKTIVYDNKTINTSFEGLAIKKVKIDDKEYIVPFFDAKLPHDGDIYFQMNGGWIFIEDKYTETKSNVRYCQYFRDFFLMPYNKLYDKLIFKIDKGGGDVVIADKDVYPIIKDAEGDCIIRHVYNGCINIGKTIICDYENKCNGDIIKIKVSEVKGKCPDSKVIIIYNDKDKPNNDWKGEGFYIIDSFNDFVNTNGGYRLIVNDKEKPNIINYFYGNNPHNGNGKYDDGKLYYEYLTSIFKYSLDTDSFDKRCYLNTSASNGEWYSHGYENCKEKIKSFGFGNHTSKSIPLDSINDLGKVYSVGDDKKDDYNELDSYKELNNKRLELDFTNLMSKISDKEEFKKYFKEVILFYTAQMIPSTCICKIIL